MLNPLEQFIIKPLISFTIFDRSLVFTNSTLTFFMIYIVILSLIKIMCKKSLLVPKTIQAFGELFFILIKNILQSSVGKESNKFFTLIFTLFIFILVSNSIGLLPRVFTTTSHISVTFILASIVFITITATGFIHNGLSYFFILLPKKTPFFLAPLIVLIELFAYFARPVSLAVRLATNMTAGHVVLKVLATFVALSGLFGVMPFILLTILNGFEIFVSILQAYIFSVLTCAYLSDALRPH